MLVDFLRDIAAGEVVWSAAFNAALLAMMCTVAIGAMVSAWKRDPPI